MCNIFKTIYIYIIYHKPESFWSSKTNLVLFKNNQKINYINKCKNSPLFSVAEKGHLAKKNDGQVDEALANEAKEALAAGHRWKKNPESPSVSTTDFYG